MEVKVCMLTVEQYLEMHNDFTMDDIVEWFGEGAVKLYWAEMDGDQTGSFAGVKYDDGSYSVFGCNCDEEFVTFEHMVGRLVGEFNLD